jgi:NADH-quinone oxidoreductase subunit N
MPVADLLPEIVLLLGAVAVVLGSSFVKQRQLAWMAGVALLAIVIAICLYVRQWGGTPRLTFSGVWALDDLTIATKLIVLLAGAAAVPLCPAWLHSDPRHGEFYALLLFALLGVIMLASASDSMELVVGMLLSSVASYPLAAFHRRWAPALEAGMKYFLVGALTNSLLCIGVVLLFGITGETGYRQIATSLALGHDPLALTVGAGCIVLGLTFKLAAFPAHAWMPDVAQGSPAPAAAFLTVIPKIGAAIALARFVSLLPAELGMQLLVALLAAATMTLGNLAAFWQSDVRRLLGWSAVAQSGYALMAVAVLGASPDALPSLLIFLATYAIANLAAFAVIVHLRGRTALDDYRGLTREAPLSALVLILSLLSLVGIPPLVGFFGKFLLFRTTLDGGFTWLAILAALNTALSLFYYLRVIGKMVFGQAPNPVHVLDGTWPRVVLVVGALLMVAGGLAMQWLMAQLAGASLLPV